MFGYFSIRRFVHTVVLSLWAVAFLTMPAYCGFLYLLNDDETGNRIYGFNVNESTGALTPLSGFPVSAMLGGNNHIVSERMFADVTNKRLYVINEVSDTVSAYSIDPASGSLTPLPFSPIALGSGGYDTIAVHPSGSPVLVANISSTTPFVHSFVITSTTAIPATGSPFAFTGTSGFSSEFSLNGDYYYVGGNTGTNIAGFGVNASNGVLTPLAGSPFPAGAGNVLAYAADMSARLFSIDLNDAIRVFTSVNGALSPVTGNPFPSGLTQRRFGLMHPNQNFYIIAGNTGNNVGVYQVSGTGAATTVAAVPGSPFATGGTTANCLAINAAGTFLFVGNRISRNVTTFSINTSTGQLTSVGVLPSNTLGAFGAINGIAYLPVSAPADIAGQVTGPGGGIGFVTIRLVSQDGTVNLSVRTNAFGFYRFQGVPTGRTYTLTPQAKAYSFTPPNIQISHTAEVTNANFVGQEN